MTDATSAASSTGEPTTGTPDPTTSGEPTTSGDSTTGEPTTEDGTTVAPEPVCGNGFVEGEELCDDGNDEVDDGCDRKCLRTGVPLWTISWDAGLAKNNNGTEIALDADGNIYVAGSERSDSEGDDAVVRKLDPAGEQLERYAYGGPLEQYASALAVGPDGSIYLGGQEEIELDGAFQSWLRKLDPAGEELWKFTRLSPVEDGYSFIGSVAVNADGVYIVGAETITDKKTFQLFVQRLDDADGTSVWDVARPGLTGLSRCEIASGPDGSLYVSSGVVEDDTAYPTLARYTADGEPMYEKVYKSTLGGFGGSVDVHSDGSVAIGGHKFSSDNFSDLWLARIDDAGDILWETIRDQDQDADIVQSLAWSSAGDIYVGGLSVVTNQQSNAVTVRYTGDGVEYWFSMYDDEQSLADDVDGVAVRDDAVIVVGTDFMLTKGYNQWIRAYEP